MSVDAKSDSHLPQISVSERDGYKFVDGDQKPGKNANLIFGVMANGVMLEGNTAFYGVNSEGKPAEVPASMGQDSFNLPLPPLEPLPPPPPPLPAPDATQEAHRLEKLAEWTMQKNSPASDKALVDELNRIHGQSSSYIDQVNTTMQADCKVDLSLPQLSIDFWHIPPMSDMMVEDPPIGELQLSASSSHGSVERQLFANSAYTHLAKGSVAGGVEIDQYKQTNNNDGTKTLTPVGNPQVWRDHSKQKEANPQCLQDAPLQTNADGAASLTPG